MKPTRAKLLVWLTYCAVGLVAGAAVGRAADAALPALGAELLKNPGFETVNGAGNRVFAIPISCTLANVSGC